MDYHGPVKLSGLAATAGRGEVIDNAVAEVRPHLGTHDLLLVISTRQRAVHDVGAWGATQALIPTDATHTFLCHEFGHILGFDHTCGIPST